MTERAARESLSLRQLLSEDHFRISERADPIPVDLRRSWRMAVILLVLDASRGNRASTDKLLLLNHAVRNTEARNALREVLGGTQSPFFLEVRVDPPFARALDFAIGLGLAKRLTRSRIELTDTGATLATALNEEEEVLREEKAFLQSVRTLATEGRIQEILRWR